MIIEEKTPDLLALLTAHDGGNAPTVPVVPQPPTPASKCAPFGVPLRRKERGGRDPRVLKRGK